MDKGRQSHRLMRRGEYFGACGPSLGGKFGSAGFGAAVGEVEPHEHDALHFIGIVAGDYLTDATGADGCAREGSVLAITPGTRHRDSFAGDGLLLTLTPCPQFLGAYNFDREVVGPARSLSFRATALLEQAAAELMQPDALTEFALETLTIELVAHLNCAARMNGERIPSWLARARNRLEEDDAGRISIGSLAEEAGVHPVYFARKFRQHTGMAPADAARRARLKKAAQALLTTDNQLATIAGDAGYADQPAFTKAFRRAFGRTPGEFRRHGGFRADNTGAA